MVYIKGLGPSFYAVHTEMQLLEEDGVMQLYVMASRAAIGFTSRGHTAMRYSIIALM